jgi:hypothetical protein
MKIERSAKIAQVGASYEWFVKTSNKRWFESMIIDQRIARERLKDCRKTEVKEEFSRFKKFIDKQVEK